MVATSIQRSRRTEFERRVRLGPTTAGLVLMAMAVVSIAALVCGIDPPYRPRVGLFVAAATTTAVIAIARRSSAASLLAWCLGLTALWSMHHHGGETVSTAAEVAASALRATTLACAIIPPLALVPLVRTARAALLGGALCVAVFASDLVALGWSEGIRDETLHDVLWIGEGWHHQRHPTMGLVYWPWGWMKAFYPSDPRGYFEREITSDAVDMRCWRVDVQPGIEVEVDRPNKRDGSFGLRFSRREAGVPAPSLVHGEVPLLPLETYQIAFEAKAERPQSLRTTFEQLYDGGFQRLTARDTPVEDRWTQVEFEVRAGERGLKGQLWLTPLEAENRLEVRAVRVHCTYRRPDPPLARHGVTYAFNGHGFRDRQWSDEPAPGATRIALLGDSFTVGYGVHAADLVSAHLQRALNDDAGTLRYETLNFATVGFSTRQELACYREVAARFKPRIVVLLMVANDPLSMEEETELGATHLWKKMERSTGLVREVYRRRWEAIEALKTEYQEKCVPALRELIAECQSADARLLVAFFRFSDEPNWKKLVRVIQENLEGTDVPSFDLYPDLRAQHDFESLKVHPLDGHPNEIAHRIAGEALAKKLRALGWVD